MRLVLLGLAAMLSIAPALADGDRGAALFAPCKACHTLDPPTKPMPGPSLAGLMGRPVAGDTTYDYSPALIKAREEGLVWDRERLAAFLADPEAMFPGLWMGGRGIADAADRAALVELLAR